MGSLCNTVATPSPSQTNRSLQCYIHPGVLCLPKLANHLKCPTKIPECSTTPSVPHVPPSHSLSNSPQVLNFPIHAIIQHHQKQRSNNCPRLIKKTDLGMGQNLVPSEPQVNSWDLWMFIPLKMVSIGIDPYPSQLPSAWPLQSPPRVRGASPESDPPPPEIARCSAAPAARSPPDPDSGGERPRTSVLGQEETPKNGYVSLFRWKMWKSTKKYGINDLKWLNWFRPTETGGLTYGILW